MSSLFFHGETPVGMSDETGSAMYDLMPEHVAALWAIGLVVAAGVLLLRYGRGRRVIAFRHLPARKQLGAGLLAVSGASHAGLAIQASGGWRLLFAGSAALVAWCLHRLFAGKSWRLWAVLLLSGSLVGYWLEILEGHQPDQIGMTVKAVEVFATFLVLVPEGRTVRVRRAMATIGLVLISVLNATAVWGGAFRGAAGDVNPLDHHSSGHHSSGITPGMVMNVGGRTDISVDQQAEANVLWAETTAFTARYRDVALAAADGYQVEGIIGHDFHAANPAYKDDGLMLDPTRPENLIYAVGPAGPVLMGVMFETEGLSNDPPELGGAALHWHRHEQVCVSLTPPGIAGLVDPFGLCPVGSVAIPTTNSMMHVWTIADAPSRFGDLDEEWKQEYLQTLAR